jgi:hypothetical protein
MCQGGKKMRGVGFLPAGRFGFKAGEAMDRRRYDGMEAWPHWTAAPELARVCPETTVTFLATKVIQISFVHN